MKLHGLFLINKPADVTSHDVVYRLRRILGTKEVGHAGTLDPMATGLMVALVGEGTKLSQYLLEKEKSYLLNGRLGYETDTLDRTGQITSEKFPEAEVLAQNPEKIRESIASLEGEFILPIPMYSAKKVDGKKLYEFAREGVAIECPQKVMKFWDVQIHNVSGTNFEVSLTCSKGSFIRSWVKLLGEKLGCGATLEALERTASFPFSLEDSISLEKLSEKVSSGDLFNPERGGPKFFVPLSEMLPRVKRVLIEGKDAKLLRDGLIGHHLRSLLVSKFRPQEDEVVQIHSREEGDLLALIGLDPSKGFQIRRVFAPQRIN